VPVFLYEYLIENSIKLYSLQALGVKNRCIRNAMLQAVMCNQAATLHGSSHRIYSTSAPRCYCKNQQRYMLLIAGAACSALARNAD
jgi:hypothetical protein